MTKKKKIILFILLSLTIIVATSFYRMWSAQMTRDRVVAWVEKNRGSVLYEYVEWAEKLPAFMQRFVRRITQVNLFETDVTDISPLK